MAIKTRSLVDVQCDLCRNKETVEGEQPSAALDKLGYRRVKMSIESIDPRLARELSETRELVVCKGCLKKVRSSLEMVSREEQAERELQEMKKKLGK